MTAKIQTLKKMGTHYLAKADGTFFIFEGFPCDNCKALTMTNGTGIGNVTLSEIKMAGLIPVTNYPPEPLAKDDGSYNCEACA